MVSVREALQKKLYGVSDTVIVSYSYDLLAHKITMVFRRNLDDVKTESVIKFSRVVTIYCVNEGGGEARKDISSPGNDSYMEVDNITVLEAPLAVELVPSLARDDWVGACQGGGNIALETYETTIVIEAAEVRVGGESFVIGDW